MKKNKYFWIFIIVVIVAIIAWYVIRRKKQNKIENSPVPVPVPGYSISGSVYLNNTYSNLPNGSYPVIRGQKSKLVYLLQASLNKLHGANLKLDGDFGQKTETALLQAYNATKVDLALAKKIYQQMSFYGSNDPEIYALVQLLKDHI